MIRAILFDLDETLLDRTQSLYDFAVAQYARFYPHFAHIPITTYIQRLVELDAHGTVWKDKVYQQLLAESRITAVRWEALLDDYVTRFAEACTGFPDLHSTLDALVARGYALGVVTNGRSPFQERNIAAMGIASHFDTVLVSEAEGVSKPEQEIFLRAARRLGVTAAETVFVGDNPQADIVGAQGAGMMAIWFTPRARGECSHADGVCNALSELVGVVEALRNRDQSQYSRS
jgi:putative hydrolase of the HAD superfamily